MASMTGLDKIIAGIETESSDTISRIEAETAEKISEILKDAEARARAACTEIDAETERRVGEIARRTESAARLDRRRKILEAKQRLIAEVIQSALESARAMPDGAYFDMILRMAAGNAHPRVGELCLSKADLARAPADLEERLNAALTSPARLTLSKRPAAIQSGFLLLYDGIEENCSFEAVFAARHDEMQDQVSKLLFS